MADVPRGTQGSRLDPLRIAPSSVRQRKDVCGREMHLGRKGGALYGALPVWLQNAAISLWGDRTAAERDGRQFRRRLEWLEETQWWSTSQIEEYQADALVRVIRHAYDTIPFYRLRLAQAGITKPERLSPADLHKLPVLT